MRHRFRRLRSRSGVSLVEIIAALVILGVLSSGLGIAMAKQRRFARDSETRMLAQFIAKNEIESLRAAGPKNSGVYVGERKVNSAGEPDPQGKFRVKVSTQVLCEGGENVADGVGNEVISSGTCVSRNAVLSYRVAVFYPMHTGEGEISFALRVGENDRFGEAKASP